MLRAAQERGAELRIGRVTGLTRASDQITVPKSMVSACRAMLSSLPWGPGRSWPLGGCRCPASIGLKGHSIVFGPERGSQPTHCSSITGRRAGPRWRRKCFPATTAPPTSAAFRARARCRWTQPESSPTTVPSTGCGACAPAFAGAGRGAGLGGPGLLSPGDAGWPAADGARAGRGGAYVATGHSVWGILNAPATGEAMAELIVEGAARSIDLSAFDPARLRPFDPARLSAGA